MRQLPANPVPGKDTVERRLRCASAHVEANANQCVTQVVAVDDRFGLGTTEAASDTRGNVTVSDFAVGFVTAVKGSSDNQGTHVPGCNGGFIRIDLGGSIDFDTDGALAVSARTTPWSPL